MNFVAELRKRNVFRVAAAYLVGAWIVMQVAGLIASATGLPEWTDTMVLIILIAGFPIVALAAWALELTPEGIKPSGTATELEPRPVGPIDFVLIAALVIVAGAFAWQMVAEPHGAERVTASTQQIEGTSIAVLPFMALSGNEEDAYLGDGLAEELLNVLAQFPDLMVAGRTSSFSFRDSNEGIQAIGTELGVSHVLEGSVRRAGEQMRVTAQLIRSSDGFHVWSGTYDRPFADVLAVQDDIVRQIAQVLTVRLGVGASSETHVSETNSAAYEQYLQGRYFFAERQQEGNRSAAINAFQTAVDVDPEFAAAWAALARALAYSSPETSHDLEGWIARGERAAERALAIDPDNAEAHVAISHLSLSDWRRDWARSQEHMERALELAPNAAYVQYQAGMHFEYLGNVDRSASAFRRAIALDPLNLTIRENAAEALAHMQLFSDARRAISVPGVDPTELLDLERDIALSNRDAAALRDIYARYDDLEADRPELAPSLPFVGELRALALASIEGDEEAVQRNLAAGLAKIDEMQGSEESLNGWRSWLYLVARDYRNTAIHLERSNFGAFDRVVYLNLEDEGPAYYCQPAYYEIWQRPGIPELMEIRRANGATSNFPMEGPECEPFLQASE